jgi:hypothetical protein
MAAHRQTRGTGIDMNADVHRLDETEFKLAERIVQALRGLRYGSVEIVVHDGRVVQFERRERVRFDRGEESKR